MMIDDDGIVHGEDPGGQGVLSPLDGLGRRLAFVTSGFVPYPNLNLLVHKYPNSEKSGLY
jgi:hypothetical protein